MKKLIINGGRKLKGEISISGSKNVILKMLVAACLTDEEVTITNVPLISDFYAMCDLLGWIGAKVHLAGTTVSVKATKIRNTRIPLEIGAKIRTSSMLLAPLLVRSGEAVIPNPGGCRIGARPIDRHVEALKQLGATISYNSEDGYFYGQAKSGLKGTTVRFEKNTHTGTETLILASVLAQNVTILENAAEEPEVDDLIKLLISMGARIVRSGRRITIEGVDKLHGTTYEIMSDRNEAVTFAIASALTGGELWLKNVPQDSLSPFLEAFIKAGGGWEEENGSFRFFVKSEIRPTDIVTAPHPGFMTDWQGPWAIFMTQAGGISTIHESVYENRFGYVKELLKMGAEIEFYNPKVSSPSEFYNFNFEQSQDYDHAIRIKGATPLHNAVLTMSDLRAGATVLLAAFIAKGTSFLYGVEQLDRGYENIEGRLKKVGADITVVSEKA